ncbi:MAG: D-glycero-beta-D-manno-heptose-7-phosphate kinase [Nitrospirota bacterium]
MTKLQDNVDKLKNVAVLVIGDLMIDEFIYGKVERVSPEAPVPIVDVTSITYTPGGAGNVVNNIYALGGKIYPVGVIGDDGTGKRLLADFKSKGIEIDGVIIDSERPTTLKSRIIAHSQQVVRVDREQRKDIDEWVCKQMLSFCRMVIGDIQSIIISDYAKGVINPRLLEEIIPLGKKYNIPIIVDPKESHFLNYKGVTITTPNLHEAENLTHKKITDEESLIEVGREILSKLECRGALITRGEDGMTLFEQNDEITHIPTMAKEVYDVTGAGDTVVSVMALALGAKIEMKTAAKLANLAAGIVVEKVGTATLNIEELKERIKKMAKL